MQSAHPITRLVLALAVLLAACSGKQDAPEPAATIEGAMQQAAEAVGAAGSTEPISAADLQARLPEELLGISRGKTDRQDIAAMGMKMSVATATYSDGDRRIDVSLTDTGGAGSMAPMAAAWAMVEFDRTTNSGYERTVRFEGFKGHEEMSRSGTRTRTALSLLLGERVVIQLKGNGLEMEDLKRAAASMNLRSLAAGS